MVTPELLWTDSRRDSSCVLDCSEAAVVASYCVAVPSTAIDDPSGAWVVTGSTNPGATCGRFHMMTPIEKSASAASATTANSRCLLRNMLPKTCTPTQ